MENFVYKQNRKYFFISKRSQKIVDKHKMESRNSSIGDSENMDLLYNFMSSCRSCLSSLESKTLTYELTADVLQKFSDMNIEVGLFQEIEKIWILI
jgi:hypothetical protein